MAIQGERIERSRAGGPAKLDEHTAQRLSLGTLLFELRERRRWSQLEVAERANLNPSTVNQLELGRRTASLQSLRRLARAFEVDVGVLLTAYSKALDESEEKPEDSESIRAGSGRSLP